MNSTIVSEFNALDPFAENTSLNRTASSDGYAESLEALANHYKALAILIEKICIPVLCITGCIGNSITVIVLAKRRNRSSPVSIILLFLSISDIFVLFTGYLTEWIALLWFIRLRAINNVACKIHVFFTYFSLMFSSWLLVLITLERAYSVTSPHRAKVVCDRRKTLIVIAILALLLLCLNGHFLYGMVIKTNKGQNFCFYIYDEYKDFISNAWIWIDFFVTFTVPFVLIAAGNALIIFQMKRHEKKRQHLVVVRQNSDSGPEQNANSITRLLILLSIIFVICSGPSSVINVMLSYLLKTGDDRQDLNLLFVRQMAFLFSGLNATLNFFLYILSGSKFREDVKDLFCFRWTKTINASSLNLHYAACGSVNDKMIHSSTCDKIHSSTCASGHTNGLTCTNSC